MFGDGNAVSMAGMGLAIAGVTLIVLGASLTWAGDAGFWMKVAGIILAGAGLFLMVLGPSVSKKNEDKTMREVPMYSPPPYDPDPYPGGNLADDPSSKRRAPAGGVAEASHNMPPQRTIFVDPAFRETEPALGDGGGRAPDLRTEHGAVRVIVVRE